jgi:hypothetical protein
MPEVVKASAPVAMHRAITRKLMRRNSCMEGLLYVSSSSQKLHPARIGRIAGGYTILTRIERNLLFLGLRRDSSTDSSSVGIAPRIAGRGGPTLLVRHDRHSQVVWRVSPAL